MKHTINFKKLRHRHWNFTYVWELRYAVIHIWRRLGAPVRHMDGIIYPYGQDCPFLFSHTHWHMGPTCQPSTQSPSLCLPHLNQTHALNACEILLAQPASAHEGADASPPSQQAAEASNNVRRWSYCAAAAGWAGSQMCGAAVPPLLGEQVAGRDTASCSCYYTHLCRSPGLLLHRCPCGSLALLPCRCSSALWPHTNSLWTASVHTTSSAWAHSRGSTSPRPWRAFSAVLHGCGFRSHCPPRLPSPAAAGNSVPCFLGPAAKGMHYLLQKLPPLAPMPASAWGVAPAIRVLCPWEGLVRGQRKGMTHWARLQVMGGVFWSIWKYKFSIHLHIGPEDALRRI